MIADDLLTRHLNPTVKPQQPLDLSLDDEGRKSPGNVIIGCCPIAGIMRAVTLEAAEATIHASLDCGFDTFDTAPHYALGVSEQRLGSALRKYKKPLKHVRIWTKVGRLVKPKTSLSPRDVVEPEEGIWPEAPKEMAEVLDYTGEGARTSLSASLKRLGSLPRNARVVGLRVHDAQDQWRFDQATKPGGIVAGLVEMREQWNKRGQVLDIGLGQGNVSWIMKLIKAVPTGTYTTIMAAGVWNLLDVACGDLFAECQKRGIKIHLAGIYASGILVGGDSYNYGAAPKEKVEMVRRWKELADLYKIPLPALALSFSFLPRCVSMVAVGVRSPEEVRQTKKWLQFQVPGRVWNHATKLGLLPSWFPAFAEANI